MGLEAYMSRVPVEHFSISIRPVGPDGLCHLYHVARQGLISHKKGLIPGSQTRDLDQGLERLYHCARHLAVLTSLWSRYSILFAMWMPYRLT